MSVIQLKRGAAGEVPPLLPGEPAIVGKNLYVADAEGVGVRMATGAELAGHAEDAVRHVTEAERAAWSAGGGDPSVFDVVIRTQAEFEALIASPTWLDAVSVCFVGDGGTLKFTRSDGLGCKIPQTVKQIVGLNAATIEVTNFALGSSSIAALWYATPPEANHCIECMTVNCIGKYINSHAYAFHNCVRLKNCTGTTTASGEYGGVAFNCCAQLINCTGTATGRGVFSFNDCTQLMNCIGTATAYASKVNPSTEAIAFSRCNQLVHCTGVAQSANNLAASSSSHLSYAFNECVHITGCKGTGTCTGSGTLCGYSFCNCAYLNGCKQGATASTNGFLGGANTKVDNATVVAV